MEIDGNMGEEFEAKVWEKRMPDLTPAEQLAVELDRFTYDYDTAVYHDNSQSMTENVSELADALKQGDTQDIAYFLYFLPVPCPVLPPVPFSPQGGLLRTVLLPACPVFSCFPLSALSPLRRYSAHYRPCGYGRIIPQGNRKAAEHD